MAGALALVLGVSDSLLGGIIGFIVFGGVIAGASALQWRRMLAQVAGR